MWRGKIIHIGGFTLRTIFLSLGSASLHTIYGMSICIDDLTNADAQFDGFLIPPIKADKQHKPCIQSVK